MTNKTTRPELQVNITVDGNPVPLVPFVEKIFGDTIDAMVRTLHGCEEASQIVVEIQPKRDSR